MSDTGAHVASGKVREIYALDDDRLLLVASDRISTFDVVLPTEVPDKGRVLTGLSAFWFARTEEICPNHLLALRPDGRSTECRRLEMLPLECVVRGYLAGSGWKDYLASGAVCGHGLPAGLRESERLPEPIFTPSTKATEGHDENIDADGPSSSSVKSASPSSSESRWPSTASPRSTPRSEASSSPTRNSSSGSTPTVGSCSRTRPLRPTLRGSGRPTSTSPARSQPSFDKQFVRDYCETLGWDKAAPGPELPDDVVVGTRARYVEAFERLTGLRFDDYVADPEIVLQ